MRNKTSAKRAEALVAYLFLAPDVIGLLVFLFLPIVIAFYVSLHKWNGLQPMEFIRFKNYSTLFGDSQFWDSLIVTLKYSIIYVPAVFVVALGFALLLTSVRGKMKNVYRSLLFTPYAISTVVAALVWSFLYDPYRGYLNSFLQKLGLDPLGFIALPDQALTSVAVVGIWLAFGYNMIIFITALNDIPQSYYEAATIDGANSLQKFRFITFPLIGHTSLFVLTMTTIGSFQVFDQIKVMTNGGPASSTSVTVYYIFQQAFEVNRLGYSSAMAFVLLAFIIAVTSLQFKLFSPKTTD